MWGDRDKADKYRQFDTTVSQLIQRWHDELREERNMPLKKRVRHFFFGMNKGVPYLSFSFFAHIVLGCFSLDSLIAAGNGIRYASGVYTSACSQVFLAHRRRRIVVLMRDLGAVAADIERVACSKSKMEFLWCGYFLHRVFWVAQCYSWTNIISFYLPLVATGEFPAPLWPMPSNEFFRVLIKIFYGVLLALDCSAIYIVFPMIATTTLSCTVLFRALKLKIEAARGEREILAVIKLHQRLCSVASRIDHNYSDFMMHFLSVFLIAPAFSSYEFASGQRDMFVCITLPIILITFVPLCVLGQELETASEGVSFAAYCGAWDEEAVAARRMRLMVILRAARPSNITVYGLGPIGLVACHSVLKTWFSFIQLLHNSRNA